MSLTKQSNYTRYHLINELATQLKKELQLLKEHNICTIRYHEHLSIVDNHELLEHDEDDFISALLRDNDYIQVKIDHLEQLELDE
jgi:hypothetical protein